MKLPYVLSVALVLFTGCNLLVNKDEIVLDSTKRAPTQSIDVYKGTPPDRKYKAIAEMTWSGPRSDELRAQKYFMNRAGKLGANALLFWIDDVDRQQYLISHTSLGASLLSSKNQTQ